VIKLPIQLTCLNEPLLERLSEKAELEELAALEDPKDKLSS